MCGTTFWRNCNCAIPINTLPAFTGRTCATWCASVKGLEQMELLVKALRSYSGSNVIVYSPTINRVEETVDFLEDHDIAAVGYHGKMGAR